MVDGGERSRKSYKNRFGKSCGRQRIGRQQCGTEENDDGSAKLRTAGIFADLCAGPKGSRKGPQFNLLHGWHIASRQPAQNGCSSFIFRHHLGLQHNPDGRWQLLNL